MEGALTVNDGDLIEAAVLDGQGVGYLWEDQVSGHLATGRLVRLLDAWCPPQPGYFLYHPSRRQTPPALSAMVRALRHGEPP